LRGVTIPTLIVWGTQDAIMPVNCGELYQQALANATLHVIDGCGHAPALEQPRAFVRTVWEFLAKQGQSAGK
jgi:2-hydroxy-6-oxonona-2,4-dienedioate hydrolase